MIDFLKERWLWLATRIFAPLLIINELWAHMMAVLKAGIIALTDQIEAIAAIVVNDNSAFVGYLEYANAFAPLNEVLVMAGLWLGLRVLVVAVRLVKGVIPTLG